MIKLSELKAKRTPVVERDGLVRVSLQRDWREDLADGMDATLRATPVLIEIAEAALAHVRALDAASDERRAMRLSDDEQLGRASAAMVRLSQTEASLRSALSAVKP